MKKKNSHSRILAGSIAAALGLLAPSALAATVVWSSTAGSTAWYTSGNWTPSRTATGPTVWQVTDLAQFQNAGTAVEAGINLNTASLSLGAIEVTVDRTRNLLIGNSSTTVSGTLTLNGITVNSVENVVLRNGSGSTLTLQNLQGSNNGSTNKLMDIALANATDNKVVLDGAGNIVLISTIKETAGGAKKLTIMGSGTGNVQVLGTSNTFTGGVVISGVEGRFAADGSLGAVPAGVVANYLTIDGGRFSTVADASFTLDANRGIQVGNSAGTAISTPVTSTAGTLTYNGVIADKTGITDGVLIKEGGGTLLLGGVNTYGGATTITQGTVKLGVTNSLPVGTTVNLGQNATANLGTFDLNGFNQTVGGLASIEGTNATVSRNTVTNSSATAAVLTLSGSSTYTYSANTAANSGLITGNLALVKAGTGTQILGEANTYTGTTAINGGVLRVGATNALPTTTAVTLGTAADAALDLNGNAQTIASLSGGDAAGGNVTLGAGTLTVGDSTNTTYAGALSGTGGSLVKQGTGKLTLSGASTYTGATSVNAGTLEIAGSLGNTAVAINTGGTLISGPSGTIAGTVTINNGGLLLPAGDSIVGTLNLGGLSVNAGGAMTFDFTSTSSFDTVSLGAGVLTLDGGTHLININAPGVTFTAGQQFTLLTYGSKTGDGFLIGTAPSGLNFSVTVNNTSAVLNVSAASSEFKWDVGGGGDPIVDGAGIWQQGSINFNNGGLQATWDNVASTNLTIGNGGVGGTITLGAAVRVGGTLTFAPVSTTAYSIGTVGSSNTLTVFGGVTANESATINAPLVLEATQSWSVAAGKTLTVKGGISGAGKKITKTGTGILLLDGSGLNTFTGGLEVGDGTVRASAADVLPSTGTLTIGNTATALVDLNNFNQTVGALAGGGTTGGMVALGSATLTLGDATSTSFAGVISSGAGGSLVKVGSGTLTLTGANTYSGSTTINGGTVQVGVDNALPSTTAVTLANSAGVSLDVNGKSQTIGSLSGGGANGGNVTLGTGTLTVGNGSSTTFGGIISGTGGSLFKQGVGTLTLTNVNTYTGATKVLDGTLSLGVDNALASATTVDIADAVNATFDLNGKNQTVAALTGGGTTGGSVTLGAGTLTVSGPASGTFAGVVSGNGTLVKEGTGTLTLGGANTYLGATTVNGGALALGHLDALRFTDSLTVASGAQVQLAALGGGTYRIGGGPIVLNGSGPSGSGALAVAATVAGTNFLVTNDLQLDSDSTIDISDGSNTVDLEGTITGSGNFTKTGDGALNLNGPESTGSGATIISGGTTYANTPNTLPFGTLTIKQSGTGVAALNINANQTVGALSSAYSGVAGAGSNVITIGSGVELTINQQTSTIYGANGTGTESTKISTITGDGALGLEASSTGTLMLAGNNTFTGGLNIPAGEIKLASSGAINSTGANALNLAGTGTLTLNGFSARGSSLNGTSGTTVQNGGTNNSTLTIGNSDVSTFNGTLKNGAGTGTLALTKSGTGELVLGGTNTYSGPTTITTGIVRAMTDSALGTSVVSIKSGSLLAPAGVTTANAISVSNVFPLTLLAGWDFETANPGNNAVPIVGTPNTPNLFGSNFGFGTIFLDGTNGSKLWSSTGELDAFAGSSLNALPGWSTGGSPGALALLGGTTFGAAGKYVVFKVDMTGLSNLVVSYDTRGTASGFSSQIWSWSTDATNWTPLQTVTGTTSTTFSTKTLDTITGLNNASTAYVRLEVAGATSSSGNNRLDNIQFSTGTPTLADVPVLGSESTSGITTFSGDVTLNGSVNLSAASGGTVVFSGLFHDGGGPNPVLKTGDGTVLLSGANTYTGPTQIMAGQLVAASNGALGAAAGAVELQGGNLVVNAGVSIGKKATFESESSHYQLLRNLNDPYNAYLADSALGGVHTMSSLLSGTAGDARTLDTTFSLTSGAANDSSRLSDVFSLTGTSSDVFVLQLALDSATAGSLLGTLSGGTSWVNAVLLNSGNNASPLGQGFAGSFTDFQTAIGSTDLTQYIGAYGFDATGNATWAVLNHGGTFAVVPEPGAAWAMISGLTLLGLRRRPRAGARARTVQGGS